MLAPGIWGGRGRVATALALLSGTVVTLFRDHGTRCSRARRLHVDFRQALRIVETSDAWRGLGPEDNDRYQSCSVCMHAHSMYSNAQVFRPVIP